MVGNYNSFNFPITHSLTPHGEDIPGMFIAKFSHDGSALLYCDALGGFGDQSANSIAVFNGSAYITGWTDARDFPVVYPFQVSLKAVAMIRLEDQQGRQLAALFDLSRRIL